jgi:hypothetical protein
MLTLGKMHRAEQRLVCVGCSSIFTRAGALMGHIERGECCNINSKDFAKQRIKKDIMKAAMLQEHEDQESLKCPTEPDLERGGVSLSGVSAAVEGELNMVPGQGSLRKLPSKRERESAVLSSYMKESDKHFPALGNNGMGQGSSTKAGTKLETDLLGDIVEDEVLTNVTEKPWNGESGFNLVPGAKPNPKVEDWLSDVNKNADDNADNLTDDKFAKISIKDPSYEDKPNWNPYEFLNALTGLFTCPHKSCSRAYKTAREFEEHLASPAHTGGTIRCPSCLRIFKSHTALISHCENATQRCKINRSANFRQIIDQISGGLLEAEGRFADGTVRFMAAEEGFW